MNRTASPSLKPAPPEQRLTDSGPKSTDEVRLVLNRTRAEATPCTVAAGQGVLFSARSPDKQTANEDSAAIIPVNQTAGVLVVADGLGGERGGNEASSLAVKTIADVIRRAVETGEQALRPAILDAIERANDAIMALGIGAATTLAVVDITDGEVRPYHVGDSMILITGGLGKIKLLTVSHAPVAMAVESGLIDEQEAMHHAERHVVSNVVGSGGMRIEIGPKVKLAPRDTVLLASDGLTDNLHTEEIINQVRKGPLTEAISSLADEAGKRMLQSYEGVPHKPDDMTMIAFRLRHQRNRSPAAGQKDPAVSSSEADQPDPQSQTMADVTNP